MELTRELAEKLPMTEDGIIIIPDSYISIGNSAFKGRSGLIYVVIPETIIEIKSFAFYRCKNLKGVNTDVNFVKEYNLLPNLNSIGSYVFTECPLLPEYSKVELRIELIRGAMEYIKKDPEPNLEFIFDSLIKKHLINLRIPLNVLSVLPNFTRENAMKYANALGNASIDWFEDNNNEDQLKFLEWMMSVEANYLDNLYGNKTVVSKANLSTWTAVNFKEGKTPSNKWKNSSHTVSNTYNPLTDRYITEDIFKDSKEIKKGLISDEVFDYWLRSLNI